MPSRRRARASATLATLACALLFVASASRARAHDDAWLDVLDDDDAEPRDDFHGFEFDDDDARDATGDFGLARDDGVEDDAFDAFDAFDADEAAVMAELREAMATTGDGARDASVVEDVGAGAEAEAEETVSVEEAPVGMEPVEVSDDVDFFDESWVAEAPPPAVEVSGEAAADDVDESPPTPEQSDEASDAVHDAREEEENIEPEAPMTTDDVPAEEETVESAAPMTTDDALEEENVASEVSTTTHDASEEDASAVQTSEDVDESILEFVDEDEEETKPAAKSGFVSSFFNRLTANNMPEDKVDESDENESTQLDVDASVSDPELEPAESIPEPELTPEPVQEPVRADAAEVEPTVVPDAVEEVPKVVDEQHDERRKLLEAPNQHEPYVEPPPTRPKIVYVGGYYKRSNPWAKGPRVKAVD